MATSKAKTGLTRGMRWLRTMKEPAAAVRSGHGRDGPNRPKEEATNVAFLTHWYSEYRCVIFKEGQSITPSTSSHQPTTQHHFDYPQSTSYTQYASSFGMSLLLSICALCRTTFAVPVAQPQPPRGVKA